ncbi:DUF4070 domain-containing protein [Candidatus Woesearchaeota archaeon]|nr:DUF4070 domain-containing protein [Candidatus Woesearchaeota archaeon]
MNILLVYPQYPETFWSFKKVLKFVSKKAAFPPLGLLTVASMLPKKWNKKLVDVNVKELDDKTIAWADMVFISAMLIQKNGAQEVINRCKKQGKKVVVGGPAFTTGHDKFKGVDHFILNEAEVTLPLFLNDLEKGNPKQIYTSKKRPDVTKTPLPMWSLINIKEYATLSVQYSRGCPFNCDFCDIIIMNGRVPRTKTPEQMMKEFDALYKTGWKGQVFIVDDNFIGHKNNVKEMLPLLIQWQKKHKFPFTFTTEASLNLAEDKELMSLMSAANFNKVFLGFETPSFDSLKECSKLQNTKVNPAETVKLIHQNGMQVMGGFIVGFDNDPINIFERQIKFIQEIGVVVAMVGLLNAMPQTRLWNRLKAEKRILKDSTGENTDGSLNFIPKMGKEKLIQGYKKIISSIYSPRHYYNRINKFIKHYKPTAKAKITKDKVKAFFRSTWKIGVRSNERFLYWKLLIKTFFTKRKALDIAVELAIFRNHFESIVKKTS